MWGGVDPDRFLTGERRMICSAPPNLGVALAAETSHGRSVMDKSGWSTYSGEIWFAD